MTSRVIKTNSTDPRVWPLAAFVLPLLVLLGIGAFGLWRERTLSMGEQARSLAWFADSAASSAGRILEKEMVDWAWTEVRVEADGNVKGRAWFRQSPLPHEETVASLAFNEGRFQDVLDRDPGAVSPGGIPLGPKAAFRLLQQAPDDGVALQAAKQVRELAFAFPSVISPELLEATDGEMERRSLKETGAGEWRERWEKLERVARSLEKLLDDPLPAAGFVVSDLLDETWLVEVRKDRESHLIRIVPLNGVIRTIRHEWQNLPQEKGMFLALMAADRDLLAGPEGSATWPKASAELSKGNLRVVALGDPSTAERATRLRIALLGSVGFLAGVMVSMGWWRQQSAVRLQQELARQKDDFLSTVSHELRTPVASMQLLAENLASRAASAPETIAAYHQRLLIESRRLASTTEHLLDFSLMERGQKAYRFAPLDPTFLGDEIRAVLLPISAAKGIALTLEVQPILPFPLADEEGIRRILLNLADNAIKYSANGGQVEILIQQESPGYWSISVRDHGQGIPGHEQQRIFERFYRGGGVLQRETRGTGIGLAVARRIADAHGGKLVLAESSSSGSVFTCTLPLQPTPSISPHENPAD